MTYIIPKTEELYKESEPIDQLNLSDGIALMINEHKKAADEVKKSSKSIELAVNKMFDHFNSYKDGRLIYVGAGTSGRVGLQDGVELFPTFNWPKKQLDFIIAGGSKAIFNAVENAEDDINQAKFVVKTRAINYKDVVIGIAASGNTPFTCKVMEEAKINKALIIVISNNPKGKILQYGDVKIILDTQEEVIAGSTRLKAGTSQKICLNVISSMLMIKFGKVKNGFMNDMVPTNQKLRKRKVLIDTKLV
jgi:N-acetylmuramic acid 6-phosphate etherase